MWYDDFINKLDRTLKLPLKNIKVKQYLKHLKEQYIMYRSNSYKSLDVVSKNYWRGMADSLEALYNDLNNIISVVTNGGCFQ